MEKVLDLREDFALNIVAAFWEAHGDSNPSEGGNLLDFGHDVVWHFSTVKMQVVSTLVIGFTSLTALTCPISLTRNQPCSRAAHGV